MAGSMVYRTRVADLSAPAMKRFVEGMNKLQPILDNRGFNAVAGYHGAPGWYCWHHQRASWSPRRAVLFLPWHRAYLWHLEQALQDQMAGVALPWWDWTVQRDVPDAYAQPTLSDGAHNPLHNFRARAPATADNPAIDHVTTRAPGRNPRGRLATSQEIADLLKNEKDFAAFSDKLQDFHDRVHVWVGGDMGTVATAAFDPIFYAHHCMIDRIWYLWQLEHGDPKFPQELLDLPLQPFAKTVKDTFDVHDLGYEYALSATPIEIS
ncbi:MAG: tyrosinase family protein [Marivibrio sp.]|uniref:tyrosinase family protein n=1 Tax=Marivibrio sp. TaxID=2039719 RepID=UPI0032EC0D6E